LDFLHALLDSITDDQAFDEYFFLLTESMHSIEGLLVYGIGPAQVKRDHSISAREIQSDPTGLFIISLGFFFSAQIN
jgi:hypothetical protein